MAESYRLAVLKYLTTYLETEVTVANGYGHTLTDAIFRGRLTFDDADPLPRASILEGLNPDRAPDTAGHGHNDQKDNWILLLQGQVPDDPVNPTDPAHALLADVKAALGKLRRRMTDYDEFEGTPWYHVAGLTIEPGTVRPPDELSNKAFFWMRIVLTITETMDDPYWHP